MPFISLLQLYMWSVKLLLFFTQLILINPAGVCVLFKPVIFFNVEYLDCIFLCFFPVWAAPTSTLGVEINCDLLMSHQFTEPIQNICSKLITA